MFLWIKAQIKKAQFKHVQLSLNLKSLPTFLLYNLLLLETIETQVQPTENTHTESISI